ncbi:MAG TPA: TadE/TadG family type IV pilus assembly protein [Caulobacteraceae bacterium]|jgi:Flp pilus assembly protein TadG|nr:TadE/TadG family type IV pilus assembly protein [Caulobacteraceae bacterium]
MKRSISAFFGRMRGLWGDRRAATAVTVALLTPVLVGSAGFVIDIGHIAVVQRQLQASTDAAALAGGYQIPSNTAVATATTYSTKNAPTGVTATMVTGYPALKCLTSTGVTCAGTERTGGANAIQVSEQAVVPMWFAQILGFNNFTVTATSTAGARGGIGEALNVMIVLDTTASMSSGPTSIDNNCGLGSTSTREQCAQAGVKTLLTGLNPSLDYVGLIVFPGLQSSTQASQEYTCGGSLSSSNTQNYGNSPVYTVVGLSNDFKSSSTATTLNATSHLALAVGDGGCSSGISAPGGQSTYYAEAINAAQADLVALSTTQSPPHQNVIVFLSDGAANSSDTDTDVKGYIGTCTTSRSGNTTCTASTTLTVTSCPSGCSASTSSSQDGPLAAGMILTGSGVSAGTTIVKQLPGGTPGGTGTYQLSKSQKVGTSTSASSLTGATPLSINGLSFAQDTNQCQQAIAAAQAAAKAGTWVYSVAYGADTGTGSSSQCTTDNSAVISGMSQLSSCTAMQYIANSPSVYPDKARFYSNNNNGSDCPNSNTIENLVALFTNLSTNLTEPRLIPNNTA